MENCRIHRDLVRFGDSRDSVAVLLRGEFQRVPEYCRDCCSLPCLHRGDGRNVGLLGYEAGSLVGREQALTEMRKGLLVCGILSSLLYAGTDMLGGMVWKGYSFTDQAISELAAVGSPVGPLVGPFFTIYAVLVIPFGLGVWASAGRNRALRVTGGLLVGIGLVGLAWTPFPMHLGEPVSSLANAMHSIFAGVQVLLILLTIAFGAVAYRNWFRFYSIGTIVTLLVAGVVGFGLAASAQPPLTPSWFGVIERINVYGYLLWVAVLAVVLLRAEKGPTGKPDPHS